MTNVNELYLSVLNMIAKDVTLPGNFRIDVGYDEMAYVQIACVRPDIRNGEMGWGYGGKRYLADNTPEDAIIRTIFSAYAAYQEHECRENFLYKGARVFGPHISVKALAQVANVTS